MTYGFDVNGFAKRTRSRVGENTAGIAKSAGQAKAEEAAPVSIKVEATPAKDGTYTLDVSVNGDGAIVERVEAGDLAATIAQLIRKVSKAAAAGELEKSHRRDSSPLGMGAPRSNRDNLRFGG